MWPVFLKLIPRKHVIPNDGGFPGTARGQARSSPSKRADEFDRLVEEYTTRLYRVVRRFASDRGEAEAIVQETWLRAWRAFAEVDAGRPLFPWLARIATNAARDTWRKRSPVSFADLGEQVEEVEDDLVGPEPARERNELLDRLALGVQRLRQDYRLVIALRYEAGFSYEESARALSIPVNTVRTYLRRAKAELRSWLEVEDARLDG